MNSIIEQIKKQVDDSVRIDLKVNNFICKDWNVYYDLYNPENFEDPENCSEWYAGVVSGLYKYYEKPIKTTEKIHIFSWEIIQNIQAIINLIENSAEIENKLLDSIVDYIFGSGVDRFGGADAKYFNYAKKTMELLHQVKFSNEDFIKRCLRINAIVFEDMEKQDELDLWFDCSWDSEHGMIVTLKNNEIISFS